ncbi:endoglucanase V-like protein [Lactarius sanguifluus]|nr:endoglucanase V-like protein [Lactarius sanguifluus]KAH9169780.1 endoglucanase V-like protein [Lactarius sanguifluus]
MKSTLILTATSLLAAAVVHGSVVELGSRATDGYVQNPSGTASFTFNAGCATPACGKNVTGFATAINQLTFGSETGLGAGDACGRCFKVTGDKDPFSANFTGPFNSIIVKATNMCPITGNEQWCGQTISQPTNSFGASVHFDLCGDSGAPEAFFPSGRGALTGTYEEVSCSQWTGTDGPSQWDGACLDGENAACWPAVACGNKGTAPP